MRAFPNNRQLALLTAIAVVIAAVSARPQIRVRRSGISDHRLAELDTISTISKINRDRMQSIPIAFGVIDPAKIGKRKRSSEDYLRERLLPELARSEYRSANFYRDTSGEDYDESESSREKLMEMPRSTKSDELWDLLSRLSDSLRQSSKGSRHA